MRKSLLVGLLVALLVSGFAGAAAVAVRGDGRAQASPSSSSTHGDDAQTEQGKPERDKADRDKADRGHGPPPWAGRDKAGRDNRGHGKPADDDWRAAWKALTPAQREARMQALAKAHDEGMQRWLACVTDAGTDQAKRKACEKPLPPGLAKRQS